MSLACLPLTLSAEHRNTASKIPHSLLILKRRLPLTITTMPGRPSTTPHSGPKRRIPNDKPLAHSGGQVFYAQRESQAGLLVTDELEKALTECKALVARIAKDCRARNRRFRDVEFDIENDKEQCLFGLTRGDHDYRPSGVERVSKIFDNKHSFFIDGADSSDIVQGRLGDCWFLSGLSTMSTSEGLIEKFCVARDEAVGIYGWIFFRDARWVTVIIDDLLFTSIPKFEELTEPEKALYHRDKNLYNSSARTGGKSLYFARSETEGETWVPLFEKAYAKLHGDYAAISGGYSCEAIEDLTGGVSTFIPTKDILDPDVFWREELLRATEDRLFGCAFDSLDPGRRGNTESESELRVNGLIGGHAYSVLRAVDYNGKRFVVLRNPWGDSEWTGPWSDGSREWTEEWLPALKALKHGFGDDGEFVMEYEDFLNNWDLVEKTLMFDDSWVMSSQWLQVTARQPTAAWSYGDISFTIFLPAATKAVIVLSKLDTRYFSDISGNSCWTFDFVVYRKGRKEVVAVSGQGRTFLRSVNAEVELEGGEYVVHVRLDRAVNPEIDDTLPEKTDTRKFSRVQTERAKSQSIASNFKPRAVLENIPLPLDVLAGQDLMELEGKAMQAEGLANGDVEDEDVVKGEAEDEVKVRKQRRMQGRKGAGVNGRAQKKSAKGMTAALRKPRSVVAEEEEAEDYGDAGAVDLDLDDMPSELDDEDLGLATVSSGEEDEQAADEDGAQGETAGHGRKGPPKQSGYGNDTVVLGLRVYTHRAAPAVVGGQLRHEMKASLASLMNLAL
ncbi:hypothetical protein FB45DRAFT_806548 [Roridomyces roridus]|uniref:Calpain catalytic domain-containing protein n=1 Tax=Roridomyces roridus TaxID=1738132 RepID=A0AAD7B2L6_9AGAR|nr:hypothetical protein FB45DRAFT_806548 [Roridomyces roridus]